MPPATPVRIGVLIAPPVQMLDIGPIDIFGMLDPSYLSTVPLPDSLKKGAIPMQITYISPLAPNSPVPLTASAKLLTNASLSSPEVAPGELDIILIPGPEPKAQTAPEVTDFIKRHLEEGGVTLITVCTGCIPAARAGAFKGKKASCPRGLVGDMKRDFPDTQWVDSRWAKDGRVWSSGGLTNGLDMVAAYIRERWPGPTTEAVLAMADVGDRGIDYKTGKAADNAWWLWQICRGLVFRKRG